MIGLPKSTEIKKFIPKKKIYELIKSTEHKIINENVSKLYFTNEISHNSLSERKLEEGKSIFVLHISLKEENYNEKIISILAKIINQHIIFVLDYNNKQQIAVSHLQLFKSDWKDSDELLLPIVGDTLQDIWSNIISSVSGVYPSESRTLDEQIRLHLEQEKIKLQISRLEEKSYKEKQPRKKYEYYQKAEELKKLLYKNG